MWDFPSPHLITGGLFLQRKIPLFMGKASISLLTGAGLLIAKLRLFESDLHCSGCILKRSVGQ